jgi:hypothetical protein
MVPLEDMRGLLKDVVAIRAALARDVLSVGDAP